MTERPELAILVGLQASGKTTFYRRCLADTHVHVSKDNFRRSARRNQARQLRLIAEALEAGRNVAVDNTNPSRAEWDPLIAVGRAHRALVIGYWFPPDVSGSVTRNGDRPDDIRVPLIGIRATMRRLRRPAVSDGFDRVWSVRFGDAGGFEVTEE